MVWEPQNHNTTPPKTPLHSLLRPASHDAAVFHSHHRRRHRGGLLPPRLRSLSSLEVEVVVKATQYGPRRTRRRRRRPGGLHRPRRRRGRIRQALHVDAAGGDAALAAGAAD